MKKLMEKYEQALTKIVGQDVTMRTDNGYYTCRLMEDEQWLSTFSLLKMPGCCGILVSTGSSVNYRYARMGVGTLLNAFRKEAAKLLGYTVLFCTDVTANEAQTKILNKNGWKSVHTFKNKRTLNEVALHVVNV